MVTYVKSNDDFKNEVENSKIPVVVDFYADWCGPCKMLGPIFEKISADYEGKVKFVKVNVDEVGEVAAKFNVMSIPTMIFFKEGKSVAQQMGALPEPMLKGWIDSQK